MPVGLTKVLIEIIQDALALTPHTNVALVDLEISLPDSSQLWRFPSALKTLKTAKLRRLSCEGFSPCSPVVLLAQKFPNRSEKGRRARSPWHVTTANLFIYLFIKLSIYLFFYIICTLGIPCASLQYIMACVCNRYHARSDWQIRIRHYSRKCPRACKKKAKCYI